MPACNANFSGPACNANFSGPACNANFSGPCNADSSEIADLIQLSSPDGITSAAIEPGAGGRLMSLNIAGHEVIATCEPTQKADYYRGSFPMAPWCGLIANSTVHFDGEEHLLTGRSSPEGPPHYHGAVHSWPFAVTAQSAHSLDLQMPIGPDHGDRWPWPGVVRQHYELTNTTLLSRLSVHTDGPDFPAGVGYHPWFVRTGAAGPAVVDFRPVHELIRTEDGRRIPGPVGDNLSNGVFAEVSQWPTISWPEGPRLELQANTPIWVTYDHGPCGFCVEPWSTPDGPMDTSYTHRVTTQSPAVLDFVIAFAVPQGA